MAPGVACPNIRQHWNGGQGDASNTFISPCPWEHAVSFRAICGLIAVLSVGPSVRRSVGQTSSVDVRPGRATVIAGSRLQLSAVPRDGGGKEVTGKTITWFAVPFDVASIDASGNLLALRQGRAQVFAVADGKTGIAVVEVEPKIPPPSISPRRNRRFPWAAPR